MNRLAILGAGGHGRVVADIAHAVGWNEIDFYDDAWTAGAPESPAKLIGNTESLLSRVSEYGGCIVAVGNNDIRKQRQAQLEAAGAILVNLVSPSATLSRTAVLGTGVVLMPGAVVNAGAVLGKGVIINTLASVDHDCNVGDFCHISPGAHLGGGVSVGGKTWIGIGAVVREYLTIGSDVVVGANAAVIKNVDSGKRVVGVPATEL